MSSKCRLVDRGDDGLAFMIDGYVCFCGVLV